MKLTRLFTGAVFALALLGITACKDTGDDFEFTEYEGVELTSIKLDVPERVTLEGSKGNTSKTVTATCFPSYATATTVYWTSSNTDVVTVSSETGSTVDLILTGAGEAEVTASSKTGKAKATVKVVCFLETTPPSAPSNITTEPHGNNILFKWTDPEDSDGDLAGIIIEAVSGSKVYTNTTINSTKNNKVSTIIPKGQEYGWVRFLDTDEDYEIRMYSIDANGNKSSEAYMENQYVCTKDAEEEDSPKELTGSVSVVSSGAVTDISWPASADNGDAKLSHYVIKISDADNPSNADRYYTTLAPVNSITVANLNPNTNYEVYVSAYSKDWNSTDELFAEFSTFDYAKNVSASTKYSGSVIVTWTDPEAFDGLDHLRVKAVPESGETVYQNVALGVETVHLVNLTVGKEYVISICTADDSENIISDSVSVKIKPVTVLWEIFNSYSSGTARLVANYGTYSHGNVVTPTNTSGFTYLYWKVLPNLVDASRTDEFTLEAVKADGVSTGLYLCIDNVKSFPSSEYNSGMGGYNKRDYPAYALSKSTIVADMYNLDYACLKTISNGNGYYQFVFGPSCGAPKYMYDTYLCVSGEGSGGTDGDHSFRIVETIK